MQNNVVHHIIQPSHSTFICTKILPLLKNKQQEDKKKASQIRALFFQITTQFQIR